MRSTMLCVLRIMNGRSECPHCQEIRISLRTEGFCPYIPRLTYSPLSRLKKSGEQIDDRVVEVHWDPAISCWRMMRFRDDKPHGNHRSVVENIIQSIADGVEKDAVRSIYAYRLYSLAYLDP